MMNINQTNGRNKGSITVEAAFVLPIVIMTIFSLIYLSFFLHDKCLIQGTVDEVLHKAAITVKHDADIVSGAVNYEKIGDRGVFYLIFGSSQEEEIKIENYLLLELSKGLFLSEISSARVKADKFTIEITVGMKTNVTLPLFGHLFDSYSYIEIIENNPVHSPAETIRATEVILDTGSIMKGVAELKEKLGEFLGTEME